MSSQWTLSPILEVECSVLGAVLIKPRSMDEVAGKLTQDDFSIEAHQIIWRAMVYLYKNNDPIDIVSVSATLEKYKRLEVCGGLSYLTNLHNSCPTASNIGYYASVVKRNSVKRQGLQLADDIRKLTEEDDFETPDQYYAMMDSLLNHMRPDSTGRMRGFEESEEEYFEFLVSKMENINLGFNAFDEWSGGIGRGWLYILAGRPSIGKTAKSLQMAINIARQGAGQVLFWSQEMTFNQLKNRMLSPITGVNYSRIRKKEVEQHEISLLRKAHKEVSQFPLYVEDSHGVTIEHIRATARQIERKKGQIGAIFVDYLTRMDIKQEKNQTWSRAVGEVAKRFKWLAQEMNCPVFILAQLNRDGADGEPRLQDLRDSGEVEQEADVVEFLWRDPEDNSPDGVVVQSTIAKGRDIGTDRFKYLFKGWIQKYEDYKEVRHEPVADIQSYQADGTTYRKISNKSRGGNRFSKRNV